MTNDTEIGHLYQMCSLIRICTISYLANNIRKTIIIIMFKLKNKNDNHFYIDIAMGIYYNFLRLSPILSFLIFSHFEFTYFLQWSSDHREACFNNAHIYMWYIILSIGDNHVRYCYCVYRLGSIDQILFTVVSMYF